MNGFLASEIKAAIESYQNTVMPCVRDGDIEKAKIYLVYTLQLAKKHREEIAKILPAINLANEHLYDFFNALNNSENPEDFITLSKILERIYQ